MKMENHNIVSVSWSDHLIFGEGDGRLDSPTAVGRRMQKWKADLDAGTILWRCTRDKIKGQYQQARGYRHFYRSRGPTVTWDAYNQVPELAHAFGMQMFLYVTLFDEGWPLLPKKVREVSYHNKMHCQHVSWQSSFSRNNPEYTLTDRTLKKRQWGVMCLAYPEVRRHFIGRYQKLLAAGDFDGHVWLLNFWATWCAPCVEEMPMLSQLQQDYAGRGLKVVGIALDDADRAREFAAGMGIKYPVLVGQADVVLTGRRYGNLTGMLPFSVLVDAEGLVRWTHLGALTRKDLEHQIKSLR